MWYKFKLLKIGKRKTPFGATETAFKLNRIGIINQTLIRQQPYGQVLISFLQRYSYEEDP